MIYIAQPYSGPEELRNCRYQIALAYSAYLLAKRVQGVYSPIVHNHDLAAKYKLPAGEDFWKEENEEMLRHSYSMICLLLDGWKTSPGLDREIKFCADQGIKIRHITEVDLIGLDNSDNSQLVQFIIEDIRKWLQKHRELLRDSKNSQQKH